MNLRIPADARIQAIWHFHSGDEGLAWRVIGLTARLCLELGLHRAETYQKISDEQDRTSALKLFWSVYVLDHRWSMGTGMSFALQDADLDENLPTIVSLRDDNMGIVAYISYRKRHLPT